MKNCIGQTEPHPTALSVEMKVRLQLLHFPTERPVTRSSAQSLLSTPFSFTVPASRPAVLPSRLTSETGPIQTLHLYVIGPKTAKTKPNIKTAVRRQIVIQTVTDTNRRP